jgi:hypothetical protein
VRQHAQKKEFFFLSSRLRVPPVKTSISKRFQDELATISAALYRQNQAPPKMFRPTDHHFQQSVDHPERNLLPTSYIKTTKTNKIDHKQTPFKAVNAFPLRTPSRE